MADQPSVINDALILMGEDTVISLDPTSKPVRTLNALWATTRDAELEANPWTFARRRTALTLSALAPVFGYAAAYPLPDDCVAVLDLPCLDYRDWAIESHGSVDDDEDVKAILVRCEQTSPVYLLYTRRHTNVAKWPATFCKALSARLAIEACRQLAQSSTVRQEAAEIYDLAISTAKRTNAIEQPSRELPESDFILVRG